MFRYRLPRRLVAAQLLVIVFLPIAMGDTAPGQEEPAEPDTYVAGQVVVKLDPAAQPSIDALNASYGTTTVATLAQSAGTYLVQGAPGADAEATAVRMSADRSIAFAEPNFIGEAPEGNPRGIGGWGGTDPAPIASQYAVSMLGLSQAQAYSRGSGVVVAVLDTGVQLDHPALRAHLTTARYDFVDNDTEPSDSVDGRDYDGDGVADEMAGHGTHVAGIVNLVAPDAMIMPLRVLNSDGRGDIFSVAEAIGYAVEHGATVINLSLGTTDRTDVLEEALERATKRGAVIIAAAGNQNTEIEQFPASDNCALSVTAIGANNIKSSFANFGGRIDLVAPGDSIFSTFPPGGYAWWSGTSMTAPFVAGQVALIHSLQPSLNAAEIAALIGGTSHSIDRDNPAYAGRLGQGRIDIGDSLRTLVSGDLPSSNHGMISGGCVD